MFDAKFNNAGLSVSLLVQLFGEKWDVLSTFKRTAMKFGSDINGPLRMNTDTGGGRQRFLSYIDISKSKGWIPNSLNASSMLTC